MNEPLKIWKELKRFEQRGDLQKQAALIQQALGQHLAPRHLQEVLEIAQERAHLYQQKHPNPFFSLQNQPPALLQGTPLEPSENICLLPREPKAQPYSQISWSEMGKVDLQVVDIQSNMLVLLAGIERLSPQQEGLSLNKAYAYAEVPSGIPSMSAFCNHLKQKMMPLESVYSLPLDLFLSAQHPVIAVTDRGAGKLHLIQKQNMKLQRSWPIVSAPNKKALSVAFHPDRKRIFVTANQPGLLVMIDRGIAQKKVPLPQSHLLSQVRISPKGEIYLLAIDPKTRRPDLWVLDSQGQKQTAFPLEGEAFSAGADAHDLFELSPDGRFAVVMVARNQPALFTPCLLLIDLKSGKIVDQVNLDPKRKPVNLAFPARQLVDPRFKLLPILRHGVYGLNDEILRDSFGTESLET